jgi:hypothetical protein
MGPLPDELHANMTTGWNYGINRIVELAQRLATER